MKIKTLVAALAVASGLVSCASSRSAIDGRQLLIVELNGTEYVSQGETPANMAFSNGRCSATVGGNIINADYKEGKNGGLEFSMGLSTKMMVPESYREDEFVAAFNSISSYKASGDEVSFMDAEGKVLIKSKYQSGR